jgi:hypothetical protein
MVAIGVLESLGTGLVIFFERISGDLWSRLLSKSLQPASLSVEPGEGGVEKTPLPSSRHWARRAQGWLHVRVANLSLDISLNNRSKSARRISKSNFLEPMGSPSHISGSLNWSLDSKLSSPAAGSPCRFASELFCWASIGSRCMIDSVARYMICRNKRFRAVMQRNVLKSSWTIPRPHPQKSRI